MHRLQGKNAIVFGGAQGIGRAIVAAFVAEGATVYASDVKPIQAGQEPAAQLVEALVDATDPAQVTDYVAGVLARAGTVDILVNNVGIHLPKSVIEAEPEDFDRIFNVNVKTAYLACRAVVPHMLERRRGSIINLSSNGGLIGRPSDPLYNASKHAVIGLTKSMAVAYAQHGLRINAVCPGAVDTAMLRGTISDPAEYEQRIPALVASTPAARVAQASEVAAAVVFLASDESPAINGIAMAIDGAKSAGVMSGDRYRLDFELNTSYD